MASPLGSERALALATARKPPTATGSSLPLGLFARFDDPDGTGLRRFLDEADTANALALWVAQRGPGPELGHGVDLLWSLERDIASIDEALSGQLDAVLHAPAFQRLEASWRGLQDLVERTGTGSNVKIRAFSATWLELARDLDRAIEFDQSTLFRKVYSDEFDMPGGEPFSVVISDHEVRLGPVAGSPADDLEVLSSISRIAAAAFAPFVVGAHPSLFGVEDFGDLERPMDLGRDLDDLDHLEWRRLRESEDARFVVMTMPRVLRREPHDLHATFRCEFPYREDVSGPGGDQYLWGPAVYAYASVLIRAFRRNGWLEDIRGVDRFEDGGGLVAGLPTPAFRCDPRKVSPRKSTDLNIDEELDRELRSLGFVPLCDCPHTGYAAFFGSQTLQIPARFDRAVADANARLSAQVPVVLNVSRFAHYLKVLARDKVGGFHEPRELELLLQRWLVRYVSANEDSGAEQLARFPLREAHVSVRDRPEKPGSYLCTIRLRPRFRDDSLSGNLRITTELSVGSRF
jgi:type VI secretion system ImpC/EvpB family protein